MKVRSKGNIKTLELVYMAICTTLIIICSWISIPTVVPFTLQTFAIFCVLEILGGKRGTFSILIYIVLAAIGIPVLSKFSGGIAFLLGPNGGYIFGFVLMGLIYWLFETLLGKRLPIRIGSMVLGLLICYSFGTAWFMIVYADQSGPIELVEALTICVIPFIIPDIIKLVLALTISSRLKQVVHL